MKRQAADLEKIFASICQTKNSISRPYKELQINKTNSPIKKVKDSNKYFTKEDIQIANKHIERYSTQETM